MLEIMVVATLALAPVASNGSVVDCLATTRPVARWALPPLFREVSGLALSGDGRLLFHNDEAGVIGAFEAGTGRLQATYTLGRVAVRGDFEGIAVAEGKVYLTTSDGILYQAVLPDRAAGSGAIAFTRAVTGVGEQCEVEGLSYDGIDRVLLFACKTPRARNLDRDIGIFQWSVAEGALVAGTPLVISRDALAKGRPGRAFHPSAIDVDPRSGVWVMLSSVDGAVASVDRRGVVTATGELAKRHRQPEGLAIGDDGRVFVADEGRNGLGTITVYDCR